MNGAAVTVLVKGSKNNRTKTPSAISNTMEYIPELIVPN